MKIAPLSDVKAELSALVSESEHGPVVITRNGKAIAAIIPLSDDDDVERLMMGYSPRLKAILAESKEHIRKGEGIPHKKFWAEMKLGRPKKPKRKPA
jgi:prevent-host-death family protein